MSFGHYSLTPSPLTQLSLSQGNTHSPLPASIRLHTAAVGIHISHDTRVITVISAADCARSAPGTEAAPLQSE
jgi:hypothetical protein